MTMELFPYYVLEAISIFLTIILPMIGVWRITPASITMSFE